MNDGRWTAFSIVNNLLLAFHVFYLLFSLSALSHASGLDIPFLFELYIILPPLTGIINARFNHSILRRNYHAAVPLSSEKKNWQSFITILYLIAALLIALQLIQSLKSISEDEQDKDVKLMNFIRILLFLFSVSSIYLVAFQLLAARNAGANPDDTDPESETIDQEEDDDE